MKKQYLISFLGLIIISIPIGNSLLSLNSKTLSLNTKEISSEGTGLTVVQDSNITFWDIDNSKTVNSKDEAESFSLKIEFNPDNKDWHYHLPDDTSTNGLNLYSSKPDTKAAEFSYNKLATYEAADYFFNDDSKIGTYTIEADSTNNESLKVWNYKLTEDESFYITADYSYADFSENDSEIQTEDIGNIPLDYISLAKETIIREDGVVEVISPTKASVDYIIEPGKDVRGFPLIVTNVKWMDGRNELANEEIDQTLKSPISGTITTNKLEPNETYANTTLIATTSNESAKTELESFSTPIGAPKFFESPEAVLIDKDHGILEIQGKIDTNGSVVEETDIQIKKGDDNVLTKIHSWEQSGDVITYDVFTDEYGLKYGDKESLKNNNINNYSLEISYILEGEKYNTIYYLKNFNKKKINREEDLSYLQINPNSGNKKLETGEIVGITIAFLFFTEFIIAGIIVLIGKFLFRRVQVIKL